MQSKAESFKEVCVKTASGFVINYFIYFWIVNPLWDLEMTFLDNLGITIIFTISALTRGYFIRRYYNWKEHGKRD